MESGLPLSMTTVCGGSGEGGGSGGAVEVSRCSKDERSSDLPVLDASEDACCVAVERDEGGFLRREGVSVYDAVGLLAPEVKIKWLCRRV